MQANHTIDNLRFQQVMMGVKGADRLILRPFVAVNHFFKFYPQSLTPQSSLFFDGECLIVVSHLSRHLSAGSKGTSSWQLAKQFRVFFFFVFYVVWQTAFGSSSATYRDPAGGVRTSLRSVHLHILWIY